MIFKGKNGIAIPPLHKALQWLQCLQNKVLTLWQRNSFRFPLSSVVPLILPHIPLPTFICPTHWPNNPELLKFRTVKGTVMLHDILQTTPSARNAFPAPLSLSVSYPLESAHMFPPMSSFPYLPKKTQALPTLNISKPKKDLPLQHFSQYSFLIVLTF